MNIKTHSFAALGAAILAGSAHAQFTTSVLIKSGDDLGVHGIVIDGGGFGNEASVIQTCKVNNSGNWAAEIRTNIGGTNTDMIIRDGVVILQDNTDLGLPAGTDLQVFDFDAIEFGIHDIHIAREVPERFAGTTRRRPWE